MHELPTLIVRLYAIVDELEKIVPGRHFTPDGHLVGSVGEALAAYLFDLDLLTASSKSVDAIAPDGRTVEIKATQRRGVALTADPDPMPDVLVVLRIDPEGLPTVVYNGPARPAWEIAGTAQKNGQRTVSLAKLGSLPTDHGEELRMVRSLDPKPDGI